MQENPRFLKVSAGRFDAVTVVSQSWTPSPATRNNASSFLYQLLIGRFGFKDFFRPGVLGAVIMFRAISSWDGNAFVTIRSGNESELDSQNIIYDQLLDTFRLTNEWSEPVLLGPTDAVCVDMTAAEGEDGVAIEFLVAELKGETLVPVINAKIQAAAILAAAGIGTWDETTISGTASVPIPANDLLVRVNTSGADTLTLPAIASVQLGRKITFIRTAAEVAANTAPTIQAQNAGDEINGQTGLTTTAYTMKRIGDSVTYTRVPGGWAHDRGVSVANNVTTVADPYAVPAQRDGILFVTNTTVGATYNLPALASTPQNTIYVLHNGSAGRQLFLPSGADTINGAASPPILDPGNTAILLASASGWRATGVNFRPGLLTLAANGAVPPFRQGPASVDITVALVVATLPAGTAIGLGESVIIRNSSGGAATIAAAGADTVNGAATVAIAAGAVRTATLVTATEWFVQ